MTSTCRSFSFAVALAALACVATSCAHGAAGPPRNLRCEYQTNPIGLDEPAPRLSWEVNDSRRGAVQSAYQIVVALDASALKRDREVVWDSGKVASDQSVHVPYAGPALEARHRYHWQVRTWDGQGQASPYSEPAYWEMGLLKPEDWSARWITVRDEVADQPLGKWIWHPTLRGDNQTIFLRRRFTLDPGRITEALLHTTADNELILYVNGREIGRHDEWRELAQYDVASALRPGGNALAVQAKNQDGPCGFLLGLRVRQEGGRTTQVLSDGEWRTAGKAAGDWTATGYDDSGWERAAAIANYGDAPWGAPGREAHPSLCLRKGFRLQEGIRSARAYVSGLGLYELSLNGRRVSEDVFAPGWTLYDKRVQYQTYDVTPLVRPGENAVGAILGNGWWSGRIHWRNPPPGSRSDLRFVLQLEVEYQDGGRDRVVTDETWKAHPSPITENDFYDGETCDARLETPGWDAPGFDDRTWLPTAFCADKVGPLVAQQGPPIRVTQELPAVAVTQPAKGVYVFDFGQNAAGRARLKVKGPAGTRVQIRFAEVLKPDGNLYTDNYRSARATDVYLLRGGGEETWEPRFTYRGFRYAELTGYPGEPPKDALVSRVLHSAAPFAGHFECSNDLLNRLQHNIVWGQRSNLHSAPTDCPQRDERLGWTGDAQCFAPTACWNMDLGPFFEKWLQDLRDSQGPGGEVPDIAPSTPGGAGAPAWADIITVLPWTLYRFYGDPRVLERNYDAMRAWVEYMHRHAPNDLYEREGYGDWVAPVGSPTKPIGAAYYYYSTKLLAESAAALGRTEDAAKYGQLAERIAAAFNAAYLRDANYPSGTQTANLLPLSFGITPPDRRPAVLTSLVQDIHARADHLSTGFLGTAYLLPLLANEGQQETAYRLATQRTYPSWGYTIDHGATTIWELWNSDTEGPGMNSRNHFAFGAVGRWFFEALAGINPDPEHPGFKRVLIRPQPAGDLTSAQAEYPSLYGMVRSAWRIEGGKLSLEVGLPANTSAVIEAPTLGHEDVTVTESGQTIVRHGRADEAVPGLRFRGVERGCAVFAAGAGSYRFTVEAGG